MLLNNKYNCLVVLGPTASGKTKLACKLAAKLKGEIISADSRQVYKKLDIGTGKDFAEYEVNGVKIPYHLIDVCEPTEQFYLYQFAELLEKIFCDIQFRGKLPIICGGSGLYLEVLQKDLAYTRIPENQEWRKKLESLNKNELIELLHSYPKIKERNSPADLNSIKRIIRAIEIAEYLKTNTLPIKKELFYKPKYLGIKITREERNKKIDERLKYRLENGLIEEAQNLVKSGMSYQRLEFLGLEYKYLSYYLQNKINRNELYERLRVSIHQYAKRQMTWFRRMEKNGVDIEWVEANNYTFDSLTP